MSKVLLWVGSSRKDMREMPEDVKADFGQALRRVQEGKDPKKAKIFKYLGESGVWELVTHDVGGTFRAVYTVKFADAIIVLHVFQKKSKSGISTPKQDIELISERLKAAKIIYQECKGKNER